MSTIERFIGWGYGSAYINFIKEFPIMKNFFLEFVDRDYLSKGDVKSIMLSSPTILNELNPNSTMIVVFSQFHEDIKKDPLLSDFENVITVWDIYENPEYYLGLFMEIKRDLFLKEYQKYNIQELNKTLVVKLNKFNVKGILIGDLMKTEINHLCWFLVNKYNTKLYEILMPKKLKFVLIGSGDILVSSLMYKRYDHIRLMDEFVTELGCKNVTRLVFYDDYVSMGNLDGEKMILEFNIENYEFDKICWYEIISSILKEFDFNMSDEIKIWLTNHIKHAISLIYLYEDLLKKILNVKKSIFILDYFRDEYILASLLNRHNIITCSMQHGFYEDKSAFENITPWEEIYYLHPPSKYRLVWGEKWKKNLQMWTNGNQNIKVVGNLKYKKVEKFKYELSARNNLLVILNKNEKDCELLIECAILLKEFMGVQNVYIKPHPETKSEFKEKINFILIKEKFVSDIVNDFNIVISAKSTAYFEVLMGNKLTFMYDPKKSLSNNPYSVFSNIEEFRFKVESYLEKEMLREKYMLAINKELKKSFSEINLKFISDIT